MDLNIFLTSFSKLRIKLARYKNTRQNKHPEFLSTSQDKEHKILKKCFIFFYSICFCKHVLSDLLSNRKFNMFAIFPTDLHRAVKTTAKGPLKSRFWLIIGQFLFKYSLWIINHVNSIIKMGLPLEALVYYNFFQRKMSFLFVNLAK